MVAFARLQFSLSTRDADGTTRRDHLEAAAKAGSASARAELDEVDSASPGAGGYLWQWFLELHAARGSNGFGANPIGWLEIASWARLTRQAPAPWEVAALRSIDHVFLEEQARADGERKKQRP